MSKLAFSVSFVGLVVLSITVPCWAAESIAGLDSAGDPLLYQREVAALIQTHCYSCHGPKKQKMAVDFSKMTDSASILGRRDTWRKAREALELKDMPPDPEETGFKEEDRAKLTSWIKSRVETIDRADPAYLDPGPPLIRQLTRTEYNNTINDLLGLDRFNAASAGGIDDESSFVSEHFPNLAAAQSLDQTLVEKYLAAADASLDQLFVGDRFKRSRAALLGPAPGKAASPHDAAKASLTRFVRRAFRAPPDSIVVEKLLGIVDDAMKAGDSYEAAVRKAMKPVLASPRFLYRAEDDRPGSPADAWRVSDDELAVRLSYFIWSSMPDDELFKLADAKQLLQQDVLAGQIKRMLADPKARALTDNFAGPWLRLNMLNRALPSQNVFPAFTRTLKDTMKLEPAMFFDAIRTDDRSVLDLVDADYTFANEELAKFYGIPDVTGPKMRKVALKPENHRGGLLGMGSILAMTSHTDRTKPTTRGKWILEVMLGSPPPPPPANVSGFAPSDRKAPPPKTFREKLAQHATDSTCASCHKRIDPLGFALENYDAVGAWREQDAGNPVDNTGKFPGGKEFRGVDGLKQVLRDRQDQVVHNIVAQMTTYALGRELQYQDDLALSDVIESLKHEDYKFSTLIRGIVLSRPFLYRRSG